MLESEQIAKPEVDDDLMKTKSTSSPLSRSSSPASSSKAKRSRLTFPFGACRVCTDSATGIHYGIATCEGCKGFFKRSILRKEKYRCYFDNSCLINVTNRNRCKACRFRRCLDEGMSVDGVKMGRIPKLVKERALRELKEQQMREEFAEKQLQEKSTGLFGRESSCSSLSDRSIENYDPDVIETDALEKRSKPAQPAKAHASFHSAELHQYPSARLSQRSESLAYLPKDFTLDETKDLVEHSTGPLTSEIFQHAHTISRKLRQNNFSLHVQFTEDEMIFTRFLRWSAYNVYLRHSKRVQQLEARMARLIHEGIDRLSQEISSMERVLLTMPKTLEVLVRSSVFYVQELPGMTNMDTQTLQKMILRRSFDWFLLKYVSLFNANGESYFVSTDGVCFTRFLMSNFLGSDFIDAIFAFCQYFQELHLTETEMSLVLPIQICYADPTMKDQDVARMLRACYLYTLYEELCQSRGEHEGTRICRRILQILDLLVPLNEHYEKHVGSRVLHI